MVKSIKYRRVRLVERCLKCTKYHERSFRGKGKKARCVLRHSAIKSSVIWKPTSGRVEEAGVEEGQKVVDLISELALWKKRPATSKYVRERLKMIACELGRLCVAKEERVGSKSAELEGLLGGLTI
eukprot:TRINITY_DN32882_c0_g1_i1.p2 TRINITY_DN32882_c0_g1~~TRINITY_DN32882_c0_g1_i1.p2  ORF type:complete len:126 (+),score=11.44 TRINITY_DN32882_c0_g1_i1:288-665(+)